MWLYKVLHSYFLFILEDKPFNEIIKFGMKVWTLGYMLS